MAEWRAYPKVNADGSGARNSWFPTDDILSNNFESGNGSVNTATILKKKKTTQNKPQEAQRLNRLWLKSSNLKYKSVWKYRMLKMSWVILFWEVMTSALLVKLT